MEIRGTFSFNENTIGYSNKEKGENDFMKRIYPHNDIYWRIINHLDSIGYETGYSPYYENNFKTLKKDHYRATKNDIWLIFERFPAGFRIHINHKKNHMISCDSFLGNYNDNFKPLSYIEKKRVELAIKHIKDFILSKFVSVISISDSEPQDPIQQIFYNEKRNSHIHDGAQSFEELKEYCNENLHKYNTKDANGNHLKCGDIKYFYSWRYGNRLCKAEVWHHINNMWWAISGGNKENIASFYFFDFKKNIPLKDPVKKKEKIEKHLKQAESEMNYEKCIHLRTQLQQVKSIAL